MEKLKNFGYQHVELFDSHWKKQRTELIETYLGLENDDLLHYFRQLSDIPDHSSGLVGWYGNNASTFGQKLGAFAKLYLVTKDERLKKKAYALADGWGACATASDRVIDINDTYVYDKLMGGFLDMLEYLDYEPAREYIRRLTQSASRRFRREIGRDGLQNMGEDMIEWYTLPEQLYRAWTLTGEEIYRTFAKEWDYPYFWDKLNNRDFTVGPRHAYSHINSLSSAARAYLVTGEERYLSAMEIAYEEVLAHHTFATGGYGPAECLFPDEEGYLGDSLKANWDEDKLHETYRNFGDSIRARDDKWGSCEVSCCSWAVFKLCNYLLTITGEAKYGDWAEKLLYNGCGGQPPVTKDGKVMYYADYFINGGFKSVEDGRMHPNGSSFEWQCCTGTYPQDVAEYANMLYYSGDDGLYVSQYLASRVEFETAGGKYTLENNSFYPKEKTLRFKLHGNQTRKFAIHFRVPAWACGKNGVRINGERIELIVKPNTWLTLEREWQDGDEIQIEYEFVLRFQPVDTYAPQVAALVYGPIVLVCDKMTLFTGDMTHPENWIKPIQKDGYSYAFRTEPEHVKPYAHLTREFYPYYEVPQMEWYYMYNRIIEDC
ncbi:MAG: glycoside hydrolase family 127 protein [Lachnospiraceae bacterium]|nr:glycoside hydrolase family 127 protein [Lachnospiraceae bacterium]